MKTSTLALAAGLALTLAAGSALAQDAMKSDSMAKMSSKDMKMMKSCQAMDHDKMMANKGCMKMMKMHPDMMSGGGMMKSDGMMKH